MLYQVLICSPKNYLLVKLSYSSGYPWVPLGTPGYPDSRGPRDKQGETRTLNYTALYYNVCSGKCIAFSVAGHAPSWPANS